jgi:diguanylate cyclase (GGDEF)-like protein
MGDSSAWRSDPAYIRVRQRSVHVACSMTVVAVALIVAYLLTTPHPRRLGIELGLCGVALGSALLIVALRAERLVETRYCDLFFGTWSATYQLMIGALAGLDGGASSPLALNFFLTLVFAGLYYPKRLAMGVGATSVACYLGLGPLAGWATPHTTLYFTGVLMMTSVVCVWQAHTLEVQRRQLAEASRTDALTGCLNRRGFDERLAAAIGRVERAGGLLSIVLIDVDGFKRVNDEHGHAAGDELLRWLVERAGCKLRAADFLGRLGGDEFAVVLPDTDEVDATRVVARMRADLEDRIQASYGVACSAAAGLDADALLSRADADLYRRKRRSRGAQLSGSAWRRPQGKPVSAADG